MNNFAYVTNFQDIIKFYLCILANVFISGK